MARVFLADGDALALSPGKLHDVLALLGRELPGVERVSCYANARNLLAKTVDELRGLREAGLELLYLGLESGDDATLADIHKGITVAEQIEGCARATAGGPAALRSRPSSGSPVWRGRRSTRAPRARR